VAAAAATAAASTTAMVATSSMYPQPRPVCPAHKADLYHTPEATVTSLLCRLRQQPCIDRGTAFQVLQVCGATTMHSARAGLAISSTSGPPSYHPITPARRASSQAAPPLPWAPLAAATASAAISSSAASAAATAAQPAVNAAASARVATPTEAAAADAQEAAAASAASTAAAAG
jgi:hypothetical protein